MAMNINEIRQFFKIGGVFRAPEATEDGKKPTWNNTNGVFDYTDDNALETAVRENATNKAEFTLKDGTKVFLTLGALAWLDSVASAVTSVFGRTGAITSQNGDYTAAQITNAFNKAVDDLDDIANGTTNVHLTAVKLAEIQNAISALHSHTNKSVLDLITAAGGGVIPTAIQIAAWDGWTGTTVELIQDTAAAMLQNITGLTWTYNDTAGTLTPTVTLEVFTTDNLQEGTTNKYANSALAVNEFTITLPASGSVASRVLAAVVGTDYPSGWILAASSSVNLLITHSLTGRRLSSVSVFEIDGANERLSVPFNTAFSGILTNGETVLIEGLNPTALALRIELIFNNEISAPA